MRRCSHKNNRSGFTLIELLVVVGILLVLAGLTVAYVNVTAGTERARAGSREVHSFLEGARDRAIFDRRARGVRFLLDQSDPTNTQAASMVYIGENDPDTGILDVEPDGITVTLDQSVMPTASGRDWASLHSLDLIADGSRIKIPNSATGIWYPLDYAASVPLVTGNQLRLARSYIGGATADQSFRIELAATAMTGQEPTQLPSGIVIDLDESKLPAGADFNRFDVLFSQRGVVTGPTASAGIIHLAIRDTRDTVRELPLSAVTRSDTIAYTLGQWVRPIIPNGYLYKCTQAGTSGMGEPPWETTDGKPCDDGSVKWTAYPRLGDNYIVTLFTRTGHIVSNPVFQAPNAASWQSGQAYLEDQWVTPTVPNGLLYRCTYPGTSGASEPAWPILIGNTVTEGAGPTWQCYDEQDTFRYAETGESAR